MYKVQNMTPGNLPIDLEVGSKMLKSGEQFDLDAHCSRKWLRTNALLHKLLASGALRLVHDSAVKIPKAPIKKVTAVTAPPRGAVKQQPTPRGKAAAKPAVGDLKDKAAPTAKVPKKETPVVAASAAVAATKEEDPVEQMLTKKPSKRSYFRRSSEPDKEEASKTSEDTAEPKKKRSYKRKKSEDTSEPKKKRSYKSKKYSKKSDD